MPDNQAKISTQDYIQRLAMEFDSSQTGVDKELLLNQLVLELLVEYLTLGHEYPAIPPNIELTTRLQMIGMKIFEVTFKILLTTRIEDTYEPPVRKLRTLTHNPEVPLYRALIASNEEDGYEQLQVEVIKILSIVINLLALISKKNVLETYNLLKEIAYTRL